MFHLAANPEYILPLREEVEAVTTQDGWTKAAMNKLRKLDSLMKESQRLNGINASEIIMHPVVSAEINEVFLASVMRKAKQDLTLSNGTFIPEGTICVAEALSTHTDENNYTNPDVFDQFHSLHPSTRRLRRGNSIKNGAHHAKRAGERESIPVNQCEKRFSRGLDRRKAKGEGQRMEQARGWRFPGNGSRPLYGFTARSRCGGLESGGHRRLLEP